MLVPGGFGSRGWEGKILACRVARERGIPYLGICLGMHVAVSEFARHVVGLDGANSTEMDPETPYPVIDLLPEQKEIEDLGGTMRLGAQAVEVADGTRAREAYGEAVVHERHRHRYEVNNHYRPRLVEAGLVVSGTFQEGGSSRSSSCPTTRGSWRASSTRSSSRGRRGRRRSSATSSARARALARATRTRGSRRRARSRRCARRAAVVQRRRGAASSRRSRSRELRSRRARGGVGVPRPLAIGAGSRPRPRPRGVTTTSRAGPSVSSTRSPTEELARRLRAGAVHLATRPARGDVGRAPRLAEARRPEPFVHLHRAREPRPPTAVGAGPVASARGDALARPLPRALRDPEPAGRGARSPTGRRELRAWALEVDGGRHRAASGRRAGNLYCRLARTNGDGGTPIFLCAHLDTVPPTGPIEPVVEDGVVRNAGGTILGADNKAAVAVMLEAVARLVADGGRTPGSSCCSRRRRRSA